jgi:cell division initiation protein
MKIAPIDISHKNFRRKAFGLDADEVTDFLKLVAEEMESLIRERNKLKEEIRDKELNLLEYKERDKVLRDTITTAQRMAEKMREDSERESKIILNDAAQKAEMIVRDARDSLKRVYQEITDIKRSKMQFETNLRAIVQTHLNMLDMQPESLSSNNAPVAASTNTRISPVSSN